MVGLLALTGFLIFGGSPTVKQVQVPNVSGQQPEAARAALQAANLLATIQPVTSSVDDKGRVVGTDPAANTEVAERTTVTLQVGNGPDQAAVPPLNGKTVAEAGPLLTERGLLLGAQTEQNTVRRDPGRQDPLLDARRRARTCPRAPPSPSSSASSRPRSRCRTSSGRTPTTRSKELEDAGFTVKSTSVDGGNDGEVASTDPAAGTQAPQKSTVTLRVFNGDTSKTDMPDVRGDRIDQAQATLAGQGFSNIQVQLESHGPRERERPGARPVAVAGQEHVDGRSGHARRRAVRGRRQLQPVGGQRRELTRRAGRPEDRVDRVRVLVVDNYDSFVYNLVQYLAQLGADTTVRRNDEVDLDELDDVDGVLVSPGPGTPERAGASIDVIRAAARRTLPLLGVCLGHQAIGVAWGGVVERAPELLHGKTSLVHHDGAGVLAGLPDPFVATRYHSLSIRPDTVPDELEVTGRTESGVVMAVRHRELPVEGVQFHPESVLTEGGHRMLANWMAAAGHPVPEPLVAALTAETAEVSARA